MTKSTGSGRGRKVGSKNVPRRAPGQMRLPSLFLKKDKKDTVESSTVSAPVVLTGGASSENFDSLDSVNENYMVKI